LTEVGSNREKITIQIPGGQQACEFASSEELMPIIAHLGIHERLLVVLPEALDARRAFVLVPPVGAPRTLDTPSHVVPVPVTHLLKSEKLRGVSAFVPPTRPGEGTYRFGVLNKRLCNAHLPLFLCDTRVLQNSLTPALHIAHPDIITRVTRRRAREIKALDDLLKCVTVGEPSSSNTDILLQTEVLDLM
jgi:hypothetical protein